MPHLLRELEACIILGVDKHRLGRWSVGCTVMFGCITSQHLARMRTFNSDELHMLQLHHW
jgi:hypothetical protein